MGLRKLLPLVLVSVIALWACGETEEPPLPSPTETPSPETATPTVSEEPEGSDEIEVRLPDIEGNEIPAEYTCDGNDTQPVVKWTAIDEVEEWIVTITDPDAGSGTFVHWAVYGIPGDETMLSSKLPPGTREGLNSFGEIGYGGPCPPEGDEPHEYVFRVTALDTALELEEGLEPAELQSAAECCVVDSGEFSAFYGR